VAVPVARGPRAGMSREPFPHAVSSIVIFLLPFILVIPAPTRVMAKLGQFLRDLRTTIVSKGLWYWAGWVISIAIALWAGPRIEHSDLLMGPRFRFSDLIDRLSPRPVKAHSTALVEIRDAEFWGPVLHSARPISRGYIARLVYSVAFYRPAVVVLDFDLSSPTPDSGPLDFKEYQPEDEQLLRAIEDATRICKLVLPLRLRCASAAPGACDAGFVPVPTPFYQAGQGGMITWGYLNLPDDVRSAPQLALVSDGRRLMTYPSLALAAARARSNSISTPRGEDLPHISFIAPHDFDDRRFSSGQLLAAFDGKIHRAGIPPQYQDDAATPDQRRLFNSLNSQIVIIGASFHRETRDGGPLEDSHLTPVGDLPGCEIHANYIEAMLDERAIPSLSHTALTGIELTITVLLTLILLAPASGLRKFVIVCLALLALFVIAYFSSIALGLFVEALLPAVLVAAHFLLHTIVDLYREAHHAKSEPV